MLAKIRVTLQPGGRLVIADYTLAEHRTRSRAEQIKGHEIDPELVRTEIGSAGFEIIRLDDPFVKWVAGGKNLEGRPPRHVADDSDSPKLRRV